MRRDRCVTAGMVLSLLISIPSLPALEVPLAYKTVARQGDTWFPSGSYYTGTSATKPEGQWKLPELKSKLPLFVLYRFYDVPRLFLLDRRQAGNPFYDIIYFDANGNRDLTDDPVLAGAFKKQSATYADATFAPVQLEVTVNGRRLPFSFTPGIYTNSFNRLGESATTSANIGNYVSFYVTSSSYYTGTLQLEGKSLIVALGDANCDGSFTSSLSIPNVRYADGRLPVEGDWLCLSENPYAWNRMLRLSNYLAVGTNLFSVTVDIPGSRMVLTPVGEGVAVRLPLSMATLQLVSRDGATSVAAFSCRDAVLVPEGAYRLATYRTSDKDTWGDTWELEAVGSSRVDPTTFSASGPNALICGPPFSPRVVVDDWMRQQVADGKRNDVTLTFMVYGRSGEIVTNLQRVAGKSTQVPMSTKNSSRPKEPAYLVLTASGEVAAKGAFEYG